MNTTIEARHDEPTTAAADQAYATLLVAFSADPIIRWILPDSGSYLRTFHQVLRVAGAAALDAGTVAVHPDGRGAAIWHPPGFDGDEDALAEVLAAGVEPSRLDGVFLFLEVLASHHPRTPVWYLPFIGVDPASHRGGAGRRRATAVADGPSRHLTADPGPSAETTGEGGSAGHPHGAERLLLPQTETSELLADHREQQGHHDEVVGQAEQQEDVRDEIDRGHEVDEGDHDRQHAANPHVAVVPPQPGADQAPRRPEVGAEAVGRHVRTRPRRGCRRREPADVLLTREIAPRA
jgi:hypothetical protein